MAPSRNDRIVALRVTEEDAREMYQKLEDKDDDETCMATFEAKAGDIREELIETFGLLTLSPVDDE